MRQPSPNILLITGDHVRADVLKCTDDGRNSHSLSSAVLTPRLDELASDGVAFRNCFTPNPICVPARASLTTGCYSHRCTGTKNNAGRIGDDCPRLAAHFVEHGYRTYAVGKLHYLPYAAPGHPRLLHGFQHAEICEEGRILGEFDPSGELHGLEDYHDYLHAVGWGGYERSHGVGNNDMRASTVPFPAEHHEEAWVAQRAMAALDQHSSNGQGAPFFMWASFAKPHPPYDPPAPFDRMYDPRRLPPPLAADDEAALASCDPELRTRRGRFGWNLLSREAIRLARARYCGLLTFQDAMIGRLLTDLRRRGSYDNTIIIYTADHGDLLGDFGRFFKSCMFDASVKVPLIVRVPGMGDNRGTIRDQLVGLQDLFPTLCGFTGLPVPQGMDGQDLRQVIRNSDDPGRPFIISQCFDHPRQKYMLRSERWKYVYHEAGGVEELYDLSRKDYETMNLAGESGAQGLLAELRQTLAAWCRDNGDTQMLDESGRLRRSPPEDEAANSQLHVEELGWRPF